MAISHDTATHLSHELVRLMKLFQSLRQHAESKGSTTPTVDASAQSTIASGRSRRPKRPSTRPAGGLAYSRGRVLHMVQTLDSHSAYFGLRPFTMSKKALSRSTS